MCASVEPEDPVPKTPKTGFWSAETIAERLHEIVDDNTRDHTAISHSSYDLSLGNEVFITGEDKKTKRILDDGEQIEIPPGQFANLITHETISIPLDSLSLINARFRLKKRGFLNVSGFHVDPGYHGKILFSMYNAGPSTIVVCQGERVFSLWLSYLDQPTQKGYDGQPRTGITSDDVNALQGDVASPQALAKRVAELERNVSALESTKTWLLRLLVGAALVFLLRGALEDVVSEEEPTQAPASSVPTTTTTTSISGVTTTVDNP